MEPVERRLEGRRGRDTVGAQIFPREKAPPITGGGGGGGGLGGQGGAGRQCYASFQDAKVTMPGSRTVLSQRKEEKHMPMILL